MLGNTEGVGGMTRSIAKWDSDIKIQFYDSNLFETPITPDKLQMGKEVFFQVRLYLR
jgi:hypothetical protein